MVPASDLPIALRAFLSIDQLAIQRKTQAPQSRIINCQHVVEVVVLVVQYFPKVAEMEEKRPV